MAGLHAVRLRREIRVSHTGTGARPAREIENSRWNVAIVVCVAMAAAGWGGGAIILYPSGRPMNEVLLVFAIGGIMLGGASLLAARPEAFLMFLLPTGFLTALRWPLKATETT